MRVHSPRIPAFGELYKAIQALPEGVTGEILEPGVIRTMARPGRAHRYSALHLRDELGPFDRERGGAGWWIEVEAEIRLPNDRLAVPDLSGWRVGDESSAFLDLNPIVRVPDWCCEVLAPATERTDRTIKLPLYAEQGVGWTWLVDPDRLMVEVNESRLGSAALATQIEGRARTELPPFGPIDLGRIWLPAG